MSGVRENLVVLAVCLQDVEQHGRNHEDRGRHREPTPAKLHASSAIAAEKASRAAASHGISRESRSSLRLLGTPTSAEIKSFAS